MRDVLSPRRRELLRTLADGERAVFELAAALGRDQANVVRDLHQLRHAGMVTRRIVGRRTYYSATRAGLQ